MHNNTSNSDTNWCERSIHLNLTSKYKPLLSFSIILGTVFIIHSWYLKWFKYNQTRLLSELCSISMIGASLCFLKCMNNDCTLLTKTILYNIVAESILIPITMVCDTYLTFKRYSKIVKGTTIFYKRCVFTYWCIFMVLPWSPFYSILPIWYDQNSVYWTNFRFKSIYISLISVISYYIYFFVLVCLELNKLNKNAISFRALSITSFIIRSLCHTLCSIIGMILTMLSFPEGTVYLYIVNSFGIHIFLNWNFNMNYLVYLIKSQNIFYIRSFFIRKIAVESIDEYTTVNDGFVKDSISKIKVSDNEQNIIYITTPIMTSHRK